MQRGLALVAVVLLAQVPCARADLLTPLPDKNSAQVESPLKVKKPKKGMQMVVGPVTVPHGSEITECTYFKFPAPKDMAVHRVRVDVSGGSHHIHIYRPVDPTLNLADGHETCNFALNFDVWQLIIASQNVLLDWTLPKGVAFMFRTGEQLVAQTHFVDNGLLATPEDGWANFNFYSMPKKKVKSFAGALFGQDRDVRVLPHSTVSATTKCVFPRPVKVLALTGHYHFRGKKFTVNTWDGVATGEELYSFEGYTEPVFKRFSGKFQPEIPGLEWTCHWQNDTDEQFTFGPFTDRFEHCNLFGFYYPTVGETEFTTCVQENQVTTVNVTN